MSDAKDRFLSLLGQLPARLTAEEAAWVLGCQHHDVPILVVARLLKPLGTPAPNAVKYFAAVDVLEIAKDRAWLAKATHVISRHWQGKNLRKKGCSPLIDENGQSSDLGRVA